MTQFGHSSLSLFLSLSDTEDAFISCEARWRGRLDPLDLVLANSSWSTGCTVTFHCRRCRADQWVAHFLLPKTPLEFTFPPQLPREAFTAFPFHTPHSVICMRPQMHPWGCGPIPHGSARGSQSSLVIQKRHIRSCCGLEISEGPLEKWLSKSISKQNRR